MKNLKVENDKLKSQVLLPVEKIDREVPNCQFKESCKKCHENSKVHLLPCLVCIHPNIIFYVLFRCTVN